VSRTFSPEARRQLLLLYAFETAVNDRWVDRGEWSLYCSAAMGYRMNRPLRFPPPSISAAEIKNAVELRTYI